MAERGQRRDTAKVAVELSLALSRLRSRLREEAGTTSSGLTLTQLAIVNRLLAGGPATATSLAAAEHVTQQAIAQSVRTLKGGGLVQTERDADDRRKVLIAATPAGRQLFEALLASREAWLVRAIDSVIGLEERGALDDAIGLLERLAGANLGPDIDRR